MVIHSWVDVPRWQTMERLCLYSPKTYKLVSPVDVFSKNVYLKLSFSGSMIPASGSSRPRHVQGCERGCRRRLWKRTCCRGGWGDFSGEWVYRLRRWDRWGRRLGLRFHLLALLHGHSEHEHCLGHSEIVFRSTKIERPIWAMLRFWGVKREMLN